MRQVRGVTSNMRDIFTDLFEHRPIDPLAAARRAVRPQLRRRFYQAVNVVDAGPQTFAVTLDDRSIRTPAGASLVLPARAIAEAVAAEWRAQSEFVDPAGMPLTRLGNTIVDGVEKACAEVAAEVLKYVGSDLLFYRAERPAGLLARQCAHWDPLLAWAREAHGAQFRLADSVRFVEQPAESLAAVAVAIPSDPWRLGAVHSITTLTGSALIALALAARQLSVEAAWAAAHVDEDWNMEFWGRDELALQRRGLREAEMRAAAAVLACLTDRA
jgi:chaperone required for assembly of F1-ATPase